MVQLTFTKRFFPQPGSRPGGKVLLRERISLQKAVLNLEARVGMEEERHFPPDLSSSKVRGKSVLTLGNCGWPRLHSPLVGGQVKDGIRRTAAGEKGLERFAIDIVKHHPVRARRGVGSNRKSSA